MSILDLSFIGLLSSAILFLLFGLLFLFLRVSSNKQWKQMKTRRIKNKKKRKKFLRMRNRLEKKRKTQLNMMLLFLGISLVTAGGAFYSRYYQLTNLTSEDAAAVAKSYYLIGEIEKQIKAVEEGASAEKTMKNVRDLTGQLATTGTQKASQGMSVEGQKLLNRHYTMIRNLALNLSSQNLKTVDDPNALATYLEDIEKVVENEKKVFKHFKVNESALKEQK